MYKKVAGYNMCGITGFFDFTHKSNLSILTKMTDTLIHRGPDDSGYELFKTDQVMIGLGHRRLSIIDLSPEGRQPMTSVSGRYVICFNGEIYNFQDIRAELESLGLAANWRGHSDTEVLLAAIENWGLKKALQKSIGMFALALWDKKEQALFLARDRMGEKPLYYGWQGKTFLFGSELKALRVHPSWVGEVDRGALCLYMRHGYIPAPYSIHQGIRKLTQGTILRLDSRKGERQDSQPEPYWSLLDVVRQGQKDPFPGDEKEAVDELERLLLDAVGKQMVSDVPLGAFLSGGYDSSLITALMQAQSTRPVKTFSIGFHEQGYNEAPYAKAVAKCLGTDHTELYVSPEQAMKVIPELSHLYDEPFADSSQIPTYLLAKMTREYVTVALSGDGGDELMRGYGRYDRAIAPWNKMQRIPVRLRNLIGNVIRKIPAPMIDDYFKWLGLLVKNYASSDPLSEKIKKVGDAFSLPDFISYYQYKISVYKNPEQIVRNAIEPPNLFDFISSNKLFDDNDIAMLFADSMTYLPDDILVKVDRAAMGASLETRIPFLDHRVVEFIWSLPSRYRWRPGYSKWALRQVLYKYVPKDLLDRSKQGFGVPVGDWIKGPMHDWAFAHLFSEKNRRQDFFDNDIVKQTWEQHQRGDYDRQGLLWEMLSMESMKF